MDERTKELIDDLIRYVACVKLLEDEPLTRKQHEALYDLKQRGEQVLQQLIIHLENVKKEKEA